MTSSAFVYADWASNAVDVSHFSYDVTSSPASKQPTLRFIHTECRSRTARTATRRNATHETCSHWLNALRCVTLRRGIRC